MDSPDVQSKNVLNDLYSVASEFDIVGIPIFELEWGDL